MKKNLIDFSKPRSTVVEEVRFLDGPPETETTLVPYESREHQHEALAATMEADTIASVDRSTVIGVTSTYDIFWRKQKRHFIITPLDCPERDHPWKRPRFKPKKGKDGELKDAPIDIFQADLPPDAAANSYFVHNLYISFRNPPRTLRRSGTKNSPILAPINYSFFWRKWSLQFGGLLADDRVVDSRGVISLLYDSGKPHVHPRAIKGYKVRKWKLWARLARNTIAISIRSEKQRAVAGPTQTMSRNSLRTVRAHRKLPVVLLMS